MRAYLDFEKPVAELEAKIAELRALTDGQSGAAITDEVTRLEGKAQQALRDVYAALTPWQKTQSRASALRALHLPAHHGFHPARG